MNVLTRKPSPDIAYDGNGLDVRPPEDTSSFSKHCRDWYRLNDFFSRGYDLSRRLAIQSSPDDVLFLQDVIDSPENYPQEVNDLVVENMGKRNEFSISKLFSNLRNEAEFVGFIDEVIDSIELWNKSGHLPVMGRGHFNFYNRALSCVNDAENPFCGYFRCSARSVDFRDFVSFLYNEFGHSVNLNWIDTSDVTDMSELFCISGLYNGMDFTGSISLWDVSKVTDFSSMFERCTFDGDLSKWTPVSARNFTRMFCDSSFTGDNGGIGDWECPYVESYYQMFMQSKYSNDLSGWVIVTNPWNGINSKEMFIGCELRDELRPRFISDY